MSTSNVIKLKTPKPKAKTKPKTYKSIQKGAKGKVKFAALMNQLKKLSVERRKYWLSHLTAMRTVSKELGAEPMGKIIQMPAQNIVGDASKTWIQETADWFGRAYDNSTLAYANQLDKVYTAVADEVAKVPTTTGKAIGKLTGAGDYWPYIIGAGAALVGIYYLSSVMPRR